MLQIPDHLVDDASDLARDNLEQALRNVRVIEASPGTNGEHAAVARARLIRARELVALFQRPGSRAA